MRLDLRHGDCIERMKEIPDNSVEASVSDPPYGLSFMGVNWDTYAEENRGHVPRGDISDKMGRVCNPHTAAEQAQCRAREGIAYGEFNILWLAEVFRVLQPGGTIKAFSGTRTFHRLGMAMEGVGFTDIRLEAWGYATGFPKSLDISKAIDKRAGTDPETHAAVQVYLREARERKGMTKGEVDRAVFGGTTRYSWVEGRGGARESEVYLPTPEEWVVLKSVLDLDDRFDTYIKAAIPSRKHRFRADGGKSDLVGEVAGDWGYQQSGDRWDGTRRITIPATPEARAWDGWGTALKPAWEPVLVGTKPASCV